MNIAQLAHTGDGPVQANKQMRKSVANEEAVMWGGRGGGTSVLDRVSPE